MSHPCMFNLHQRSGIVTVTSANGSSGNVKYFDISMDFIT